MDRMDLVLAGVAMLALLVVIAGAQRKVVIYYDGEDLLLSLMAVVLTLAGMLMFDSTPFDGAVLNSLWRYLLTPLVSLAAFGCLCGNFFQAWRHTRNGWLAVMIGMFKLLFIALLLLVLIGQLERLDNTESDRGQKASALLLIAFAGLLTHALLNGKAVYTRKGWGHG